MNKPSFFLLLCMISTGLAAQEKVIVNRSLDTCIVDLFSYNFQNDHPWHTLGEAAVLYHLDVDQDGENDLAIGCSLALQPETPLYFTVFPEDPNYFPPNPPKWEAEYVSSAQVDLASITTYSCWSGYYIDMWLSDHVYDTLDYFRFGIRHTIEVDDSGQPHYCYGWIEGRVRAQREGAHTHPNNTLCLDRLVYCTIPDYPLQWGQTSLAETTPIDLIELYPNPTQDKVTINGMLFKEARLYDVFGQLIVSQNEHLGNVVLDLGGLKNGLYFVLLKDNDGKHFVKKVVKQ